MWAELGFSGQDAALPWLQPLFMGAATLPVA
jgi:hypothetical protein